MAALVARARLGRRTATVSSEEGRSVVPLRDQPVLGFSEGRSSVPKAVAVPVHLSARSSSEGSSERRRPPPALDQRGLSVPLPAILTGLLVHPRGEFGKAGRADPPEQVLESHKDRGRIGAIPIARTARTNVSPRRSDATRRQRLTEHERGSTEA